MVSDIEIGSKKLVKGEKKKLFLGLDKMRIYLLLASTTTFLLFLIFSYLVATEVFNQFDFDTTVRLQDNIPRSMDYEFSLFSILGSSEVMAVLFLAIVLFGIRKPRRLLILAVYPLFHVVEIIGKTIIDKEPPPFMFLRYTFGFQFPAGYVFADSFSYPSGHVGRTTLLSVMGIILIWRSKKKKKYWKLLLIGIISVIWIFMFISRVYLGEHWTSDVIGGSLLGLAFALFAMALW